MAQCMVLEDNTVLVEMKDKVAKRRGTQSERKQESKATRYRVFLEKTTMDLIF